MFNSNLKFKIIYTNPIAWYKVLFMFYHQKLTSTDIVLLLISKTGNILNNFIALTKQLLRTTSTAFCCAALR